MHPISFPGLFPWKIYVNSTAFSIGPLAIRWYGILIAAGLLLAMFYGLKRSKEFHITSDDLTDVIIFSLIFGIIGARFYYVLFFTPLSSNGQPMGTGNPYFQNPLSMLDIRSGGLGIYGGIIGAFVTAFIVCRIKKISVGAVFDIASLGFLIGQAIGRWGNFVNQEAYGTQTKLPWGMRIFDYDLDQYITVHPCFLYESLWCVLGFILLHIYSKKYRKFNGEIFLLYAMWYSFGRFFIEALRTDSLYIGFIKISQLIAVLAFVIAFSLFLYKRRGNREVVPDGSYTSVYSEAAEALRAEEAELEEIQKSNHADDEDEDEYEDEDDENSDDVEEVYPDDALEDADRSEKKHDGGTTEDK